ncbi:MAG: dihydrolipoyl dehydrogenase [Gammaproteobacteria bacterium]|jgi:dihydrolipoamide dehydrogenase
MTEITTEVLVLGAGPGGYTAAFRAADLGKKVTIVEQGDTLGGVCLNVGCIPSKALLHITNIIDEAREVAKHGVEFGEPKIDIDKIRGYKDSIVAKLTGGLKMLAKMRKIEVIHGEGKFVSDKQIKVGEQIINFEHAIIAAGSSPVNLPFLPDDPRIIDSTGALELKETKGSMLILGGGIIGLEMATVYSTLGTEVTIVEMLPQIVAQADPDIIKPLQRSLKKRCKNIWLETKVTKVEAKDDGLYVTFEGKHGSAEPQRFDRILAAIGRKPNGKSIGAENAGVNVDERGFIAVDKQQRTNIKNIFAIGDIVGNPMLAHKAIAEGRVAAEVIAGFDVSYEHKCIPSVAYTHPEVSWVGLTETEAKEQGVEYEVGTFPWTACGRSLTMDYNQGITKILFEKSSDKIIGAEIVGLQADNLIGELALAIENGLTAKDIAKTIHPHPTLSETIMMAAEVFEGTVTDLPPKK